MDHLGMSSVNKCRTSTHEDADASQSRFFQLAHACPTMLCTFLVSDNTAVAVLLRGVFVSQQ